MEGSDNEETEKQDIKVHPDTGLVLAKYKQQVYVWPRSGRYVMAQYNDEGVLVYQAFSNAIADYAIKNQCFIGCPQYNPKRMTWIKTSFLWMMYRSGWGKKHRQERVLGIWLKRESFERYLSTVAARRNKQTVRDVGIVRLQWDPDHTPTGDPVKSRRAMQLGLKRVEKFGTGEDIVKIVDVTSFVAECRELMRVGGKDWQEKLYTPQELIYKLDDPYLIENLETSDEVELDSEQ
eukprot:TRINITY_DN18857_c0_g1_i1.p1 TRINITY_DN18857_c0_g1~~TRINITY_DN18857_c0_g1_i1.p1  ORF type:complete len:248 (+),score=48.00 TRINITY_DN18857_c0_g1_i1:40-744(+)